MKNDPLGGRKSDISAEFNGIAKRYDLLSVYDPSFLKNIRKSAERMQLGPAPRVLDLCCGTGQSIRMVQQLHPDATIVGVDRSPGMLDVARSKDLGGNVTLVEGDAQDPASSGVEGPFDGILSSWGIRNVPDPDLFLRSAFDLLKPGGTLGFHEFILSDYKATKVKWDVLSWGFIIPFGLMTSPKSRMYHYLWKSVAQWMTADELCERMRAAGFVDVRTEPFGLWWNGILHTFLAKKPE
jgi:ubiquinone/menaquinone biosynthesis C-methylase UbiE